MQEEMWEVCKREDEVVLLSPTGSGKTLAFLLPLTEYLSSAPGPQCLIVVPGRELAQQISRVFQSLRSGWKVLTCYGGHSVREEVRSFRDSPDVLIGTPGRLAHHANEGHFDPTFIHTLVLDEFDKSLELGFEEDMSYLISLLKRRKRTWLTSATSLEKMPGFMTLSKPLELNFLDQKSIQPSYQLKKMVQDQVEKPSLLFQLICKIGQEACIIFCNTRESVEKLSDFLITKELVHDIYHGGMEQTDRERSLAKFRNGSLYFWVATDLAARGLDIPEVKHVIHYDLPDREEVFIHRNGRTSRWNNEGIVYILADSSMPYPDNWPKATTQTLEKSFVAPEDSPWQTLFVSAGKKMKISKGDILGFVLKKGELSVEDVHLIEVREHFSYVAVKRALLQQIVKKLHGEKIKKIKVKVEAAY